MVDEIRMKTVQTGCKYLHPLFLVVMLLCVCSSASAHNGPAYPIVMDQVVPPYQVSVWTDPDVGIGTFYIVLAPQPNMAFQKPDRVEIAVQPVDKRLAEVTYPAKLQDVYNSTQYAVKVPFDKAGKWRVRVLLHSSQGSEEIIKEVEATPDDLGRLGILLYLFPFVAIGVLWFKGTMRERRRRDELATKK